VSGLWAVGFGRSRRLGPVVGVAGDGEFVVGQVRERGLAGAVVVVGGGRVARRQPFQPLLKLGPDRIGLARGNPIGLAEAYRIGHARAYLIDAWRHVGYLVVGP
jgi:hypothetical protein